MQCKNLNNYNNKINTLNNLLIKNFITCPKNRLYFFYKSKYHDFDFGVKYDLNMF